MAVGLGPRLAARAPVPVHVVAGAGGREALLGLRASDRIEVTSSPRHASVLLVGGALPSGLVDVVGQVHDQLPQPRSVVWWGGDRADALAIDGTVTVAANRDVVEVIQRVHTELLTGERPSTALVGPATNPVEWQGVGPHGQGGEGMMGGRPYGRAMAMTGPDVRDGLQLDRVALRAGPALPGLPAGLALDLQLQGDVIQHAELAPNPFASRPWSGSRLRTIGEVFDAARVQPVTVADLEAARARYHLLRVAEVLALHGLAAAARRVARSAARLDASSRPTVAWLRRWLLRLPVLWGATAGVGRVDADVLDDAGVGGVAARAAGVKIDGRADTPVYRALGFQSTTRRGGDARARWRQRLDEALQAIELAADAQGARVGPGDGLEDPRDDSAALLAQLPEWLVGLEWGDALTTIASLDVDLEAVAGDHVPAGASG